MKSKRLTSLLGIEIEGNTFSAVQIRQKSGKIHIERTLDMTLSLDLLSDDPKLVGREILDSLATADIREKRCIVCVPLNWILSTNIDMPDLTPEDREDYISVQAERKFPFSPEEIAISTSQYLSPDGSQSMLIAGIPQNRLSALEKVLRAAKLKVQSITTSIASLAGEIEQKNQGSINLRFNEYGVDMTITLGGSIVALRRLIDTSDIARSSDELLRQLRITLGQLPAPLRKHIRKIYIYGDEKLIGKQIEALRNAFKSEEITVDLGKMSIQPEVENTSLSLEETKKQSLLILAAAKHLSGVAEVIEFLAPQKGRFESILEKVSARSVVWIGVTSIVIIAIFSGMLLHQKWSLAQLKAKWNGLEDNVATVKSLQEKIRSVRSWYVETPQTLNVLKVLTEIFPEKGTVWISALRIKSISEISITGRASRKDELLKMLDRLKNTKGIEELRILQIQEPLTGKEQILFTLNFDCTKEITDEK